MRRHTTLPKTKRFVTAIGLAVAFVTLVIAASGPSDRAISRGANRSVAAATSGGALSAPKLPAGVTITHSGLPDTKDSANAYEVFCTITADTTLIADSLLLWYQLSAVWYSDTLMPTANPQEYHGYIPPQVPGTKVNYYLTAYADNGEADTTEIYTFRVIDYAVILSPSTVSSSGAVDDEIWFDFVCTNDGSRPDAFLLIVDIDGWLATLWDSVGTTPIDRTLRLPPGHTYPFKVRLMVGPSMNGDVDTCQVVAQSLSSGLVQDTVTIFTTSKGGPLSLPFADNFVSATVNIGLWVGVVGVTVDSVALNPPSPPYSLHLRGEPLDADTIMSQLIDLGGSTSDVNISYSYQRTGGGESPDSANDLIAEYYNDLGNWVTLSQHPGTGHDMIDFADVIKVLPADGLHGAFRLRFCTGATSADTGDWFVDDVRVDYEAEAVASPLTFHKSLMIGRSASDRLFLANTGEGMLMYSLVVVPELSPMMKLFDRLLQQGRVQPARDPYFRGWAEYEEAKGDESRNPGPAVVFDAGGPDQWGYVWLDSDEPESMPYDWIEIESTGIDVTAAVKDDNFIGPFPIGFDFPFYDSSYSEFYIASNGFIGFGPTTNYRSFSNQPLPCSLGTAPKNIICWCWDDMNVLDPDNPGGKVVRQLVDGSLVVEFARYPECDGTVNPGEVITAEVILYPNGDIKLQYQSFGATFDIVGNTIGIQNRSGTGGLQVAYNTDYIRPGLAVSIVYRAPWLSATRMSGDVPGGQADTIDLTFSTTAVDTGFYQSSIQIHYNDPDPLQNSLRVPVTMKVWPPYPCGDASGDYSVDISDPVFVVAYIFAGGPPPDPLDRGDANCDAAVDISDAVYLIAYIFGSGPQPCAGC